MRYCPRFNNTRSAKTIWIGRSWVKGPAVAAALAHLARPATVNATDPDAVPAMPAGLKPDLS
jgi:hypothetical protein